ncbi:MAG: serine/threonine protein kinase, partial [bacterium]|nr:serine/threonine protein kinase [bacterium]
NYIHSKHIIHRDMKPANIMLINKGGNPDYVKLLDFGLSRMKYQSQLTHTGVLVGTANYMAPEQITDLNYSTAGDIYSLGIIFYEMLSGKTAFQGDSFTQVEMQILKSELEEPISSRPEIPPDLNQLVMRMINKEPGFRPFADEIKYQLEDIILISLQES